MFETFKAKHFGSETYGIVIKAEDASSMYIRSYTPTKKVYVRFNINGHEYQTSQRIYPIFPIHLETMQINKGIRLKIYKENPQCVYINEFDYPEYRL